MPSYLFKSNGLDPALPVTLQGEAWGWLELGAGGPSPYLWLINLYSLAPTLQLDGATDFPREAGGFKPLCCMPDGTLLAQEIDTGPASTERVYKITRAGTIEFTDQIAEGTDELAVGWFDSLGRVWAEVSSGDDRAKIMSAFNYTANTRFDEWSDDFGDGFVALFFRAGGIAGRVYASQRDPGEAQRIGYFDAAGAWLDLVTFSSTGGGRWLVGSDGYLYGGNGDTSSRDFIQKRSVDGALVAEVALPGADPSDTVLTGLVLDASGKLWVQGTGGGEVNAWCVNAGSMEVEISGVVNNAFMSSGQDFNGQSAIAILDNPPTGRNQLGVLQFAPAFSTADVDLGLDVVQPLSMLAGLLEADLDVSSLIGVPVTGYVISSRAAVREMIEPLMGIYFFDATESDDQVKYVLRGGEVVMTIPEDDLGAEQDASSTDSELLRLDRTQEMELPLEMNLSYLSAVGAYEVNQQPSRRLITEAKQSVSIGASIVLDDDTAKRVVDAMMYCMWLERKRGTFQNSRKYQLLEPTDPIVVIRDGISHRFRITKKTSGANGVLEFEAAAEDPTVYTQFSTGAVPVPAPIEDQQVLPVPPSIAELFDLPMLRDADNDPGFYFGGYGTVPAGWQGEILYQSTDGGLSYAQLFNTNIANPSTIGFSNNAPGAMPELIGLFETGEDPQEANELFDEVNQITVTLVSGALQSSTRDQLLQGANAIVLGSEVMQFRDAAQVSATQYILTGLLRGRIGTEHAMLGHTIGERFALLDPARIRSVYQESSLVNRALLYKPVSMGSTLQRTTPQSFTNTGVRRKPLAPWRLAGGRNGAGDLLLKWKPRTRFAVRWGLGIDNGVGETEEKYVVYIPSFAAPVRVIQVSMPNATYTVAQQIEDYGVPQAFVEVEVCQVSPEFGLGYFNQGAF